MGYINISNISKKDATLFEFLGWVIFIFAFIALIRQISDLSSWNSKKDNYFEEYVYSEFGTLYYESDGKRVYIQKIYNTDNEEITIQVPNNETILMYINKDNINEGIYFNLNNSKDYNLLNPSKRSLLIIVMLLFPLGGILCAREAKRN